MRSPAYYRTRTIVRWTFWPTVILAGAFLTIEILEWFTWSVWYDQPVPEPGNYPIP